MTQAATPPLTSKEAFRFWIDERVRFADIDILGHVNNKAFMTYAESARAAFLIQTGLFDPRGPRQNVVARIEIDYRRELHYPNELRVGLCVSRIGNKSFVLSQGIFAGDSCVATVNATMVHIDTASRQTTALGEKELAILQPWLAGA
ncbi:MAG TPA: thioesterase family protein [Solimonas sp.]|nr:thioesterase family protein [Solimonas sp.]